jgi:hypothetical protein
MSTSGNEIDGNSKPPSDVKLSGAENGDVIGGASATGMVGGLDAIGVIAIGVPATAGTTGTDGACPGASSLDGAIAVGGAENSSLASAIRQAHGIPVG